MRRRLLAIGALVLATQVVIACSTAPQGIQTVAPPQSSGEIAGKVPVQALGLNIPWAVGGLRVERDGTTKVNAGDWPTVPFRGLRLWDTRTAWLNLEPAPDQFDFGQLDALVQKAQANGITDITLVLDGTPRWAASSFQSTDASWLGSGSASMPADIGQWTEFVDAVARRYAGQITSYEIGNEPNLRTFWSGTADQYAQLVTTAAAAIRAADPAATVLFNGGLVRSKYDVATLGKWLGPLAAALGSGLLDAVSLHYYPQSNQLADAPGILKAMKTALAQNGFGAVPAWITEINVRRAADLTRDAQASAVQTLGRQLLTLGFERAYWYAWTDISADDLVPFQPETGGSDGLAALGGAPVTPAPKPTVGPTAPAPTPTAPPSTPTPTPTDPATPAPEPTAPAAPAPSDSPSPTAPTAETP